VAAVDKEEWSEALNFSQRKGSSHGRNPLPRNRLSWPQTWFRDHVVVCKGEHFMKQVAAIIKPSQLGDVQEALTKMGVEGMTIMEVKGFGRQKGHSELYRGAEYTVDFLPKVKVQVLVTDAKAGQVVDAIVQGARTGKIGDGKIFVTAVEEIIRIRTGEKGADAI
jgi:nitrogen regulatory protein PII